MNAAVVEEHRGDMIAMNYTHKFFKEIMWGSSKIHVSRELQLPPREECLTIEEQCIPLLELGVLASDLVVSNLTRDLFVGALSTYIFWFVVGCYYYCVKKYDQAKRYFG